MKGYLKVKVTLKEKQYFANAYICTFRGKRHTITGGKSFVFEVSEDTTIEDLFKHFLVPAEVNKVELLPNKSKQ